LKILPVNSRAFSYAAPRMWNSSPDDGISAETASFNQLIETFF